MNRCSTLIVAGLALAATGRAVISASPVRYPAGNVDILVDGTSQRRYAHDGRWYVEALKGREYAIRLQNPYGVRVAVALSVDGLNTIDARETTAATARKWVLDPFATVTISGWQTSQTEARRFEFTTEEKSYGRALGKTGNLGVISAVFFKERGAQVRRDSHESADGRARAPHAPAPQSSASAQEPSAAVEKSQADEEYAATGMGRRTGHVVTRVWLDLEQTPVQTVNIRYEFRPQLVRLGILPRGAEVDPLKRRERAQGFEDSYAPVQPGLR
jgi:hypothetical protein